MKVLRGHRQRFCRSNSRGLTLVEVLVALSISLLTVSGIVGGYLFSIGSTQRSTLFLAAGEKALERLEETRGARWDIASWPAVDELWATNFPDQVVILDQAGTGAGVVYATNYTQITQVSIAPPLKAIHVDCVWSFKPNQLLTNSVETLRTPDQ